MPKKIKKHIEELPEKTKEEQKLEARRAFTKKLADSVTLANLQTLFSLKKKQHINEILFENSTGTEQTLFGMLIKEEGYSKLLHQALLSDPSFAEKIDLHYVHDGLGRLNGSIVPIMYTLLVNSFNHPLFESIPGLVQLVTNSMLFDELPGREFPLILELVYYHIDFLQNLFTKNPQLLADINGKQLCQGRGYQSSLLAAFTANENGRIILKNLLDLKPALAQEITGEDLCRPMALYGNLNFMTAWLCLASNEPGLEIIRLLFVHNPLLTEQITGAALCISQPNKPSALLYLTLTPGGVDILTSLFQARPALTLDITAEAFCSTIEDARVPNLSPLLALVRAHKADLLKFLAERNLVLRLIIEEAVRNTHNIELADLTDPLIEFKEVLPIFQQYSGNDPAELKGLLVGLLEQKKAALLRESNESAAPPTTRFRFFPGEATPPEDSSMDRRIELIEHFLQGDLSAAQQTAAGDAEIGDQYQEYKEDFYRPGSGS